MTVRNVKIVHDILLKSMNFKLN